MIAELEGYDWNEAFAAAGEPASGGNVGPAFRGAVPGVDYDFSHFTREEVASLSGISEGENDGQAWICYGRLKDGRWFYLEAGCDYTGWDCQASGSVTIARDEAECIRFAMTEDARLRFGIES